MERVADLEKDLEKQTNRVQDLEKEVKEKE